MAKSTIIFKTIRLPVVLNRVLLLHRYQICLRPQIFTPSIPYQAEEGGSCVFEWPKTPHVATEINLDRFHMKQITIKTKCIRSSILKCHLEDKHCHASADVCGHPLHEQQNITQPRGTVSLSPNHCKQSGLFLFLPILVRNSLINFP